jgi:signal transduction histidine kinase
MIVLNLITEDARLAGRMREAAGSRALVMHFTTPAEAAARGRGVAPDVVVYDCGGRLDGAPMAALRSLAPRRPVVMLTSRHDPLAEGAWLKAGASAVHLAEAPEQALEDALALVEWPVTERAVQAVLPGLEITRAAEPDVRASWESAMRCLSRQWNPMSDTTGIARLAVDVCLESLRATRAAVLLKSEQGDLLLAASANLPEEVKAAYQPGHGAGLAASLDANPRLLRAGGSVAAEQRLMQLFGVALCVPLTADGQFEGALLIGPPASGHDYIETHEDLALQMARFLARGIRAARTRVSGEETQAFYDWSLSEAPVGLVCLDATHKVTAMNREAEALLGLSRAEADGRHIQVLNSALCDLVMRAAAGEAVGEMTLLPRVGNKGMMEARVRQGDGGKWMVSVQASSEPRVRREDAAAAALWEGLASRMAQEIKNPLVAINTFAQLLPRKYDSSDFRSAFSKVVQEEVDRINRVVETLYQFAREPELKLQKLDVKTTVREVVDTFARAVAERGIQFESNLSETPLSASIDADAFKVVLQNLMQNAVDAMPEGGRVSISAEPAAGGIEIRVEDSGKGIAGDEAGKVFEPFYSSRERGAGLGLAVAKKLVEAHEGTIALEGTAPGARFIVRFPTLAGAAKTAGEGQDADDTGN